MENLWGNTVLIESYIWLMGQGIKNKYFLEKCLESKGNVSGWRGVKYIAVICYVSVAINYFVNVLFKTDWL